MYTASSPDDLFNKVEQKRSAWCGFQSLLQWDSHTCVTRISPFHDAAVAVVHPPKHGAASHDTRALPSKCDGCSVACSICIQSRQANKWWCTSDTVIGHCQARVPAPFRSTSTFPHRSSPAACWGPSSSCRHCRLHAAQLLLPPVLHGRQREAFLVDCVACVLTLRQTRW